MTYPELSATTLDVLRSLEEGERDGEQMFYNGQDDGVSIEPANMRRGPGPELTPRVGAASIHEGKS